MVAWGKVNNSEPILFFVDTGLAGGGFTCPKSTLEKGNIKLDKNNQTTGIGGGGKVSITPFIVKELMLGEAIEYNVKGLYTSGFPIENLLGFKIGGIISHEFFRNYNLTFDFVNMNLILKRTI